MLKLENPLEIYRMPAYKDQKFHKELYFQISSRTVLATPKAIGGGVSQ